MSEATTNEMPSAVLKAEHQVILRVIGVLQRLVARAESQEGFEAEAFGSCVEFFRFFADACHHAKEEDLLFPVLEQRGIPREGGPIGCMLEEHRQGRELTRQMGEALEAVERAENDAQASFIGSAKQYIDLLTNHIFKEDNVLFNMGDQMMSPDDQQSLGKQFCDAGCRLFGGKKREELEAIADDLEAKWPAS